MRRLDEESSILHLQELVLKSETVENFLDELAGFAASVVAPASHTALDCSVMLRKPSNAVTIGASCPAACAVDHAELDIGKGPCLAAFQSHEPVLLEDIGENTPWPELKPVLERNGYRSVLGIPVILDNGADAVLNFMTASARGFDSAVIDAARSFADVAADALRLSMRVASAHVLAGDLKAAMAGRTMIDLACGAIMARHRCCPKDAFGILVRECEERHGRMHAVAQELLQGLTGHTASMQFER